MLSVKHLCLLLALSFFSSTNTNAENVTVSSGDDTFLPCPLQFNPSHQVSVKWLKVGNDLHLCSGNIKNNTILDHSCSPRFKVNTEPLGLNITRVESSDAGVYNCVMTKVIPPPTVDTYLTLSLKVLPSHTLQLTNSINSSCVKLLCSLPSLSPQQVNFTWTRATQLLYSHKTSSMNSTLTLCKPNWTEGETFTCQASYSRNHTLSKSITLPGKPVAVASGKTLIIAAVISAAGLLLLCIPLCVCIFQCKKRYASSGPTVYRNKIYENFTFSTSTINPAANPQNAQPGARSDIRSNTRSNPQRIRQIEKEECVYEN